MDSFPGGSGRFDCLTIPCLHADGICFGSSPLPVGNSDPLQFFHFQPMKIGPFSPGRSSRNWSSILNRIYDVYILSYAAYPVVSI